MNRAIATAMDDTRDEGREIPSRLRRSVDTVLNRDFWNDLGGTTLKLAVLFWLLVIIVDSVNWGVAGTDPVATFGGKLKLNLFGALLTVGITAVLYRYRRVGLLTKAAVAFALSALAAPLYGLFDFVMYIWCVWPVVPVFDWHNFGITLISSTAMFFGWSCLYVSLVYSFDVRDRERKLAAVREEALGAQMRALRYQVNPHFLFNTLNSIAGLIEEGSATQAERMVLSLSTFLRTTLSLDPMHDVPLADEISLQEEYLEIERERFSDRMVFSIDVPEDVHRALVPSLILQPLIENAIKHGVGATVGKVEIFLRAERDADRLRVSVENDMPVGSGDKKPDGMGVGLRNVAERLHARFQGNGQFSSGPIAPGRYRAAIDLPWRLA